MFQLNLKIALRNLWKNKSSSLINISGLAIGLASCLLLLLYVSYEWNFDKQDKDAARIYQVLTHYADANGEITGTGQNTGNVIGPLLKRDYPEVEASARLGWGGKKLIANGTKSFKRESRFADPDLLHIFKYTFIEGNPETALNEPDGVVVTASTAKLLFGHTAILNSIVRLENKLNLRVTGVIKDPPLNTSVRFDYLLPWSLYETQFDWVKESAWTSYNWVTLVKLIPGANVDKLNNAIKGLIKKNTIRSREVHFLFPLAKLHLYDTFIKGKNAGGKIEQVRLFMGLAIGVLFIACINFMNMATAKSQKRAKEVGIRKTIGASRQSLISQFLIESLVLTFCSAVIGITLVELLLPLFNRLLDIQLIADYNNIYLWGSLASVVLLTGLIAGSYPAFYLSSFNPVQTLKHKGIKRGITAINLRQVLVIGQFSFALILIIATAVIYKQIQYIKNRPVGYQINQLIETPQEGELFNKFDLLKDPLIKSGAVTSLYQSSGSISRDGNSSWGLDWKGMAEEDKMFAFNIIASTYDLIKTTGVKLTEGRDFSPHFASDTTGILLSRSAVKQMNFLHPIGQIVKLHGENRTVVGVFDDFIWGSPFKTGRPMVIFFNKDWDGTVTMRLNETNPVAENMAKISSIIKQINPAYPVELNFVDQLYAEKLKDQKILGILSNLFGGLAIFISCLGLFALAAYSAEQRTKEIGVRKVLGASVSSLIQLLSFGFLKMVMIAIIISIPIANYIMAQWLKGFEIHTGISWLAILLIALSTLAIALFTVSFQAYRAAKTNPVDALKYE